VIRENHRPILREMYEEVGISKSLCHTILIENRELHKDGAKFVPRLLAEEEKANSVR
jgi:hypothetical protein